MYNAVSFLKLIVRSLISACTRSHQLAVLGLVSCLSLPLNAAFLTPQEPRSMGMGGTGVASGNVLSAPFYNPALLVKSKHHHRFEMALPALGGQLRDPDDMLQDIYDLQQDLLDELDDLNQLYNSGGNGADARIGQLAGEASRSLKDIQDENARLDMGAAITLAFPGKNKGFALSANSYTVSFIEPKISDADITLLQNISDDAQDDGQINDPSNLKLNGDIKDQSDLTSSADATILTISEAGLSYAWRANRWAFGITPKMQRVRTYQYTAKIDSRDSVNFSDQDYSVDNYIDDDSFVNLDLGWTYDMTDDGIWRFGMSMRNAKSYVVKTSVNNDVYVDRLTRIGLTRSGKIWTFAIDMEMTNNRNIEADLNSRYLGVGGEIDLGLIVLRAGHRANMENATVPEVSTLGAGLRLMGLVVDVAAIEQGGNDGAIAQFSLQF